MNTKIKNSFNQAAESYDTNCHLQKSIGDKLSHLLSPHHFNSPKIIDLGCGTGIVTEKIASIFNHQEFHAIDFADDLLKKASERLSHTGITIYNANFDQLPKTLREFDIIFSNMALHWSINFQQMLKSITTILNEKGILAFSIPLQGTLNELQPHFSINQFAKSADITKQLEQNGCEVLTNLDEKITLHFDNTLSALQSIKNVGANAVTKRLSPHMCGKSFLAKIKLTKLTYYIGYFIARKKEAACQSSYLLQAQTQTLAKHTSASEY